MTAKSQQCDNWAFDVLEIKESIHDRRVRCEALKLPEATELQYIESLLSDVMIHIDKVRNIPDTEV